MSNANSWMLCGDADCMADKVGADKCPCKSEVYRMNKIKENIDSAIKSGIDNADSLERLRLQQDVVEATYNLLEKMGSFAEVTLDMGFGYSLTLTVDGEQPLSHCHNAPVYPDDDYKTDLVCSSCGEFCRSIHDE